MLKCADVPASGVIPPAAPPWRRWGVGSALQQAEARKLQQGEPAGQALQRIHTGLRTDPPQHHRRLFAGAADRDESIT